MVNDHRLDDYAMNYERLAGIIARCAKVQKLGSNESWTLAHALLDLNGSFQAFTSRHLPALLDETKTADEVCDILHDMGEEFRHILYHIRDPQFYRYLPGCEEGNQDE